MTEQKREKFGRNRLGEQNQTPLNQTYTLGSSYRGPTSRKRSGSQEEDKLSKTFTNLFPRTYPPSTNMRPCQTQSQALTRMLSGQLPSLEGCSPERICCQRPWTRTQIELAKYKETLKHLN